MGQRQAYRFLRLKTSEERHIKNKIMIFEKSMQ